MRLLYLISIYVKATVALTSCSPVSFDISASADNVQFSNAPDPNNATAIHEFLTQSQPNGTQRVSGTFTIKGIYCRPSPHVKSRDTLQFLVHGMTYDKSVWSGYGNAFYDWQSFALSQGYHTLAVDRLGYGENPQRPDPINVVQGPIQVNLLHNILQRIRAGTLPGVDQFCRIAWVSHSYGSVLGNHIAEQYPTDVNALILTGFSGTLTFPVASFSSYVSAANLAPRFAGLPLGYVAMSTASAREEWFYAGLFSPAVVQHDFNVQNAAAVAEPLSLGITEGPTGFGGHVFVISGDKDDIFCAGPDACASILAKTGIELFPMAASYGFFVAPETGHCLTLEYSAPLSFAAAHAWLGNIFSEI